jgi:hypothetical protein
LPRGEEVIDGLLIDEPCFRRDALRERTTILLTADEVVIELVSPGIRYRMTFLHSGRRWCNVIG